MCARIVRGNLSRLDACPEPAMAPQRTVLFIFALTCVIALPCTLWHLNQDALPASDQDSDSVLTASAPAAPVVVPTPGQVPSFKVNILAIEQYHAVDEPGCFKHFENSNHYLPPDTLPSGLTVMYSFICELHAQVVHPSTPTPPPWTQADGCSPTPATSLLRTVAAHSIPMKKGVCVHCHV